MACYLVFTSRMNADQAILFVRAKRPNSIQTRGQLLCVREFAQFLVPLRSIFSCAEPKASAVSLSQYLTRQSHLLHGYEARQMKHVPKIIQLVCRLLVDIAANRQMVIEEEWLEIPDLTAEVEKTVSQQALQQLGKEMRGKGIPVPPCSSHPLSPPALQSRNPQDQPSDNELDPLWQEQNAESPLKSSLSEKKILSYSDSVLYKPGPQQYHSENLKSYKPISCLNKHSFSHSSLTGCNSRRVSHLSSQDVISIIQVPNPEAEKNARSPSSRKKLHKWQQSLSLDLSEQRRKSLCYVTAALSTKSKVRIGDVKSDVDVLGEGDGAKRENDTDEVPFISLQSELSAESRRLLVAKALAMDLTDNNLTSKVSQWQVKYSFRLSLLFYFSEY